MDIDKIIKKEKKLWHDHFVPSVIAGLAVALLAYGYQKTLSDIVLFASVGASAVILTNTRSHHLTSLRVTIEAYLVAIIVSLSIFYLNTIANLSSPLLIFLTVFFVSIFLYSFNAFHPPAITAALSFILLHRPLIDLFYLLTAIIILMILIRLATYIFSQHLSLEEFIMEFRKIV